MTMSDTIRGTCGHNWLDFGGYPMDALDDDEFRAVEAQVDACDICLAELMDMIRVISLLDEAFAAERQQRTCRNWWPPRRPGERRWFEQLKADQQLIDQARGAATPGPPRVGRSGRARTAPGAATAGRRARGRRTPQRPRPGGRGGSQRGVRPTGARAGCWARSGDKSRRADRHRTERSKDQYWPRLGILVVKRPACSARRQGPMPRYVESI
jgi:hypothetical protein